MIVGNDNNPDRTQEAINLIAAITSSISSGCLYFSMQGTPLRTHLEVLDALCRDGEVNLHVTKDGPYITTKDGL